VRIGLHEAFLKDIFGIFVVLRDVLGQAVNLALIPLDELAERARVTRSRTVYEREFISLFRAHPPMIR
jgi:hypothetical protein